MSRLTQATAKDVAGDSNGGILADLLVLSTDIQRSVTIDVCRIATTINTSSNSLIQRSV